MAAITPLTGQTANAVQTQRIDSPGTDNIARTRSTETIAPAQNAAKAVQENEQTEPKSSESTEKGEENQNTPERQATFTATA